MMDMDECVTEADDVYDKIVSGAHVLVEYHVSKGKKSTSKKFIGICQNDPAKGEVVIMFLKSCNNDLFFPNDKDVVSVPLSQIKAVLSNPAVMLKGDRVYYRFKKCITKLLI
jgi:hypothetical protein